MLVTFLARLGGEEGGGERGSWKRREKVSLERAISRAVSALSQEADVASGNDVDGRLSLSSANNIQHRPVYTHPIYLHRGFLPLRARASLVERAWKREPCACAFAAYLCMRLRHNCRAFVSYTRIIGLPRHVGPLLFRPSRLFLYFRARKGRRES